jgi:hypothetical protein
LIAIGGSSLLKTNGLSQLLLEVYPNYSWLPWKFSSYPSNYWDDFKNQRKFMDWAGKEMKIKDMSDWHNVSFKVTLPL